MTAVSWRLSARHQFTNPDFDGPGNLGSSHLHYRMMTPVSEAFKGSSGLTGSNQTVHVVAGNDHRRRHAFTLADDDM